MLSSAHRVPNARDSRRKVGVPDQARWTGRRRTGNGADPRASASSKLLVAVVAASVSVEGAVKGAVAAGAKRSQLDDSYWRVVRVRKFVVLAGRRLVASRASIMEPNVAFGADFREGSGSGSVTARPCAFHDQQ